MDKDLCNQLLDYYNGQLTKDEKFTFEKHLETCRACQEEWNEWNMLTDDLPYLSEEVIPPAGMKERIFSSIFEEDSEKAEINKKPELVMIPKKASEEEIIKEKSKSEEILNRNKGWITAILAAGLLLSLGMNAYLFATKSNQASKLTTELSETFKTVALEPNQSKASGIASMVKEDGAVKLIVHTRNMSPLKGKEAYQVWLISGNEKFRAGSFLPDSSGNGAVDYAVNIPGKHKWEAVAVTHEPTKNSQKPQGYIVLQSKL